MCTDTPGYPSPRFSKAVTKPHMYLMSSQQGLAPEGTEYIISINQFLLEVSKAAAPGIAHPSLLYFLL